MQNPKPCHPERTQPRDARLGRIRRRRAWRRPGRHRRCRGRSAGRQSTLLIECYGFLGGMGTAAGVTNFCGLHANVHGTIQQVVHGVADDLLDRMRALGGLNEPHVHLRQQDRRAGL